MSAERARNRRCAGVLAAVACLLVAACQATPAGGGAAAPVGGGADAVTVETPERLVAPGGAAPTGPVAAVCDNTVPGPATAPPGAVTVDPAVEDDLQLKTLDNPAGTTFWLAPGVHTFGPDPFAQAQPRAGNSYIGAPGAILDGRGLNRYAFTGNEGNVTIRHLTVRGFVAPAQEGVVNHDSAAGWVVEHNTIEDNRGAGLMTGDRSVVRANCLRDNGQYGMNGLGSELLVEGNELVGNNADDLENTIEGGCGCSGGVKFWDVDGADVRGNWVHDNLGVGVWMDTNNNDFLVEGNVIENNHAEGVFYETSYNLVLRDNLIRNNADVKGGEFAARGDNFPVAAVYLSEAGGEPRVPARTDKIEIYGNVFENNWSGITVWENADRFCNSAANTSTGFCTLLVESVDQCAAPAIATQPLLDDCRWRSQRIDIHDNVFRYDPEVVGCSNDMAGLMAVIANYGTVPEWSPYVGTSVQEAITYHQQNVWHDNTYSGPWAFVAFEPGGFVSHQQWQGDPIGQDAGSTFTGPATGRC